MAEAFPENIPENPGKEDLLDRPEKHISVLLLATKWQFDTYGLSTVNKSLVNNLRVVDPEGKKIKITCAVVEDDINTKDQKEDAERHKVILKGAKQPRGQKMKPHVEWLDKYTGSYYLDLVRENSFDFIIGHVPYLANGSLNLRDMYITTRGQPKVILMIHDLPRTTDGDIDEDSLLEWLSEADVVFSVGKEVEADIFASLPPEKRSQHKLYIPGFPLELFNVRRGKVEGNKVQGTQNVTLMTGDKKDLKINGLDFPVAVTSAAEASKHIRDFHNVKTNFVLLTSNKDDKEEWKKNLEKS